MTSGKIPWPHAPIHRLEDGGVYMITTGTYQKSPFFRQSTNLNMLHGGLLSLAAKYNWALEAWAVFANHYHFIGRAAHGGRNLPRFLGELHSRTAALLNKQDKTPGRKVWHNYWDTQLTHQASYLARLSYVHQNAVKHQIVSVASQYPWCSAAWFERTATEAQIKTLYSFKTDQLHINDDY